MLRCRRVLQLRTVCEFVGMPEQFKIGQRIKRSAGGEFLSKVRSVNDTVMKLFLFPTSCGRWHSTCVVFPEKGKKRCEFQPCLFPFNIEQPASLLTKHKEVTRTYALCGPQIYSESQKKPQPQCINCFGGRATHLMTIGN